MEWESEPFLRYQLAQRANMFSHLVAAWTCQRVLCAQIRSCIIPLGQAKILGHTGINYSPVSALLKLSWWQEKSQQYQCLKSVMARTQGAQAHSLAPGSLHRVTLHLCTCAFWICCGEGHFQPIANSGLQKHCPKLCLQLKGFLTQNVCVIHFPTCTLDFFLSMDCLLLISLFCISIFWSPPSLRKTLIAAITLKNYSKKKTTELRIFSVYSYYSIIFITYLSCHIDRQALR